MSFCQINLCSVLLRNEFGEVVEKVFVWLLKKGSTPSFIIAQETGLKLAQVKQALCVLIQHNLVTFEASKRGTPEYSPVLANVLSRPRFPQYAYMIKSLYGGTAELIVEELLHHGQRPMSSVVITVKDRINEALQASGQKLMTIYQVRDVFESLTQTQFIHRCPSLNEDEGCSKTVPVLTQTDESLLYVIPQVDLVDGPNQDNKKRKRSTDDSEQPSKKAKTESGANSDGGIYWQINYERFDRHLRDQTLIKAIARKVDMRAGEILRNLLRLSEVSSDIRAPATNPLSYNEIFQSLPKELNLSRQMVDQYFKIMVEDSVDFIQKNGESGGGMYSVNFQKAFSTLCKAHIESVVQERFGSKALRIYRLLLLKKQLEQKQIEEFGMVPSKEAKELLYTMFAEHFVTVTEVPKTPDHAPSRTFFLFSVNLDQVARMLLERCYKTFYNLVVKSNQEVADNKRLLDKQQRMEAIIASLDQTGADDTQKEEIQEMITPAEKTQLTKVTNNTKKLSRGELQLDETIHVLQVYIQYAHLH